MKELITNKFMIMIMVIMKVQMLENIYIFGQKMIKVIANGEMVIRNQIGHICFY